MVPGRLQNHTSSMGKGNVVGTEWERGARERGQGEEASDGVHRPWDLLALELLPDSAAPKGIGLFSPPWVLWASIWSVSRQGLHKAVLNSGYNSDK